MRLGVLGDVHANCEALDAVLRALASERIDQYIQVGDLVGYGPEPSECIAIVRSLSAVVCMGNHDAAVLGLLDTSYFNTYARAAILWTRQHLQPTDLSYLRSLPYVARQAEYTVVHGSLHLPAQFGYVVSVVEAADCLAMQDTRLCFLGHSHVPAVYLQSAPGVEGIAMIAQPEGEICFRGYGRVLLNVGSVGQPRDEDPRAAYAVVDTVAETIELKRVPYNLGLTQRKIYAAGLPEVLATRLAIGL